MQPAYTIITGALGGLGSAFAFEFASRGTNLILIDQAVEGKALEDFLSERFQIKTRFLSCDLSDNIARSQLFQNLANEGIIFDGLVNVVGQEIEGKFLTRTRHEILYMLHLNMDAMVDLSLFALSLRDTAKRFLLINVASLAGFFPIKRAIA